MSEESKSEYVELTIKVEKPIIEFVEALCGFIGADVDSFWQEQIRDAIDGLIEDPRSYIEPESVKKRYGLTLSPQGET